MRIDPAIVRDILRSLFAYIPEHDVCVESFALAPYGPDDEVLAHWDRLRDAGWIVETNDVRSNRGEDFLTYRPAGRAYEWATSAWDEERWAEASERLPSALEDVEVAG